jgi:transcription elongation GreA/GreB family factor
LLWRELQRAVVLSTDHAPSGLIHLNSTVCYTDLIDPLHRTVQLVSPGLPTISRHGLSVASPVGAALIGLQGGRSVPVAFRQRGPAHVARRPRRTRTPARPPALRRLRPPIVAG